MELHKLCWDDETEENGLGGACGTHGGEDKFVRDFCKDRRKKEATW